MNLDALTDQILSFDSMVWQPFAMPLVLVIVGGLLTLMTGVVQIRRFPLAAKVVFGGAFGKRDKSAEGAKTITPFQALSTALAATVGNGNIGGVATAILIGGGRRGVLDVGLRDGRHGDQVRRSRPRRSLPGDP